MTFSNFLKHLADGDTSLYLTTQKVCLCTVIGWYCLLISLGADFVKVVQLGHWTELSLYVSSYQLFRPYRKCNTASTIS